MAGDSGKTGRWLLTGVGGVLGQGLAACRPAGRSLWVAGRRPPAMWPESEFHPVELSRPGDLACTVRELRPAGVLHAAAMSRLADCEADPSGCLRVNLEAVAELLSALGPSVPLILVSSDQVFDGTEPSYDETHPTSPTSAYGRAKADAEAAVLSHGRTVVRLPLLLGPGSGPARRGADQALLDALAAGRRPRLFVDEVRVPVAADLAAQALWRLIAAPEPGVFHLAGADAVSRAELGRRVCEAAGVAPEFDAIPRVEAGGAARPERLVLGCSRARAELGWEAPDLRQSLARLRPARP